MITQNFGSLKKEDVGILLVEDDEVDQLAIKRAFNKMKIKNPLIIAEDGQDAIEQLRAMNGGDLHRPYLIILDLNMPRMNGFEFLEAIRNDKDLLDSVVFVLTTSKDEKDKLEAYNQNIAGYMVKGDLASKNYQGALQMLEHYWRVVELPN